MAGNLKMRYEGCKNWDDLIQTLESQISSVQDRSKQSAIYLRIGKIYDQFLFRKGEAMAYYQKAVKADPQCLEGIRLARRIYEQMGKIPMASRLVDLELNVLREKEEISLAYYTKGWYSLLSFNYDDAIDCFRKLVELYPDAVDSQEILDDLIRKENIFEYAVELEKKVGEVKSDDYQRVVSLYNRASVLYCREEEFGNALRCSKRACLINPDDPLSLLLFEEITLASDKENRGGIYGLYDEICGITSEPLVFHPRLLNFAARALLRFEDVIKASEYLARSLEIRPDHEGAFIFVSKVLEKQEGGVRRAIEYARKAAGVCNEKDAKRFFLEEAMRLYREGMGDTENSERIRKEILNITEEEIEMTEKKSNDQETGEIKVSTEVELDLSQEKEGKDLVSSNQKESFASDSTSSSVEAEEIPPYTGDLVQDMKTVWVPPDNACMEKIEEAKKAESEKAEKGLYAWRNVLGVYPFCREALEGILRTSEATQKWNYAIDALKKLSQQLENNLIMKNRAILAMASIYRNKMNQETSSISLYQQVLKSEPENLTAMDELLNIYNKLGRWPDYIRLLAQKIDYVKDKEQKLAIALEVAKFYLEKFNNQGEAIKYYEKALEIDRNNEQAVQYLLQMYEKRRDWEKYISLSLNRLGDDLAGNFDELLKLAKLADERVRKPNVSMQLWEKVLTVDPNNDEAIGNLSGLYEKNREWEKLTGILKMQAQRMMDLAQKKAVLLKLGLIYTDKVKDDAQSIEVWKEILQMDPNERRAIEQLKKKYVALGMWDELENLIEPTGKWDEMVKLLEARAGEPDVPAEVKKEIYYRIAHVYRDRMGKPERTASAYEQILQLDPDEVSAAEALIPIYEEKKAFDNLVGVLKIKLAHAQDSVEKHSLILKIATHYIKDLHDPKTALDWYMKGFEENPLDEETAVLMEEAAEEAGLWEEVEKVYKSAIEKGDKISMIPVSLRLGNVILKKLNKHEEALKIFEGVLEIDEENEKALESVEEVYTETGKFTELQEVLLKRLDLTVDPEKKIAIRRKIASIYVEALNDRPKAIESFKKILEDVGDDLETLKSLGRLYEEEGRWDDLVDCYQRQLALFEPNSEDYFNCMFGIAQVYESKLGDIEQAIGYYRDILDANPSYEPARKSAQNLLSDEKSKGIAAQKFISVFEKHEEWDGVVKCLEILAETGEDRITQISYLKRAADLYIDKLSQPEKAFVLLSRALKLDPSDVEIINELEQIAEVLDAWKDLDEFLTQILKEKIEDEIKKVLWLRVARIRYHKIEEKDEQRIIEAYTNVLNIDSQEMEALNVLEEIYEVSQNWKNLLDILRVKSESVLNVDERKKIYFKMAGIYDEMLGNPEEAINCYREILGISPNDLSVLKSLESIYSRLERWNDLADNISSQIAIASSPMESIGMRIRLAQIREQKMGEVESAIEIYKEILTEEPSNEKAIESLERLVSLKEYELQVAEILEPIYRESRDPQKIIFLDGIFVKHSQDSARTIALLKEMAELYEIAMDDPSKAFETLSKGLILDPYDSQMVSSLERLARVSNSEEKLLNVYEDAIQKVQDSELKVFLHKKAASLCESEIGSPQKAVSHFKSILELDPGNMEAIESLERIFSSNEDYSNLAEIYEQKAKLVTDAHERKELFLKSAQIHEEILDDVHRAIRIYSSILEDDPEDLQVIEKISSLYSGLKMWNEFIEVYKKKAEIVFDPEEKKKVLTEIGHVYLDEIKNIENAIEYFKKIIELDPDDREALKTLDSIFTNQGKWEDLLSVIEKEAELSMDPQETIELRFRLGSILKEKIGDIDRALKVFEEILSVMPEHSATVEFLEKMVSSGEETLRVAKILEPIYEANADWNKLVWCLELQVNSIEDNLEKVNLLHRIAGYQEDERYLGQVKEAFTTYCRALQIDPKNEATLTALERIAESIRNWQELASQYDSILNSTKESDEKIIIGLRVARVYEEELGNVGEAIRRYKLVIDTDNTNAVAIHSLSRLYRVAQNWENLLEVLDMEISISQSEEEVLDLKFEKARISYQELGRVEPAIEIFKEIIEINPDYAQANNALELLFDEGVEREKIFEILSPLYESTGEWEKLCSKMVTLVEETKEKAKKLERMLKVAEIYETKLLDGPSAFGWYANAYMVDPDDEKAYTEMERLADMLGEWQRFSEVLTEVLQKTEEKEIKLKTGKRLADILEKKLYDLDKARSVYEFLLDVDEHDPDVLDALDRMYSQDLEWQKLAKILGLKIEIESDSNKQVEILTRYGEIFLEQLSNPQEAEKAFRRIMDEFKVIHRPALEGLEKIYIDTGEWKKLFEVCEKELEIAESDDEMASIYTKMAQISSVGLDNPDKAIELWNKVIEIKGDDSAALSALAELYEGLGRYGDLVEVLDRGLMLISDEAERIKIYEKLGTTWSEKLGRDRNALECWDNILAIEPGNANALLKKADIYERLEEWEDLIGVLERAGDAGVATLGEDQIKKIYSRQAKVLEEKLDRPFDAIESWLKVLRFDPEDREALEQLRILYWKCEMWEEYIGILNQMVSLIEPDKQIPVYEEIATTWTEKVGLKANAADAYASILKIDPLNEKAFSNLEEIYKETENTASLIQIYLDRYEVEPDKNRKSDLLLKTAKLYEDAMGDEESAFLIMQKAYLENFENPQIVEEVERITAKTGKWEELIAGVNTKIAELGARIEAVPLYLQVGKWYGERLGHIQYATAIYGKVLQMDPGNVGALSAIADLYKSAGQWDNYVHYLKIQIDKAKTQDVKKEILIKLGKTYEDELGKTEEAMETFQKVIEIDPFNADALDYLEEIYRRKEMYKELSDIFKKKIEYQNRQPVETSREKLIELYLDLGQVYEINLASPLEAVQSYRNVVQLDEGNMEALKGLERLFMSMEKIQDLVDVLEMQLEATQIEKEKIELLKRIATHFERDFLKPDQAIEKYEQILSIDPDNEDALISLEKIYRSQKKWEDMVQVIDRHVYVVQEEEKKISLLLTAGQIVIEELKDNERAINIYSSILDIDSTHPQALSILANLYEQAERYDEAYEMMESLLKVTLEPAERVELLYRMGVILDTRLGRRDEAIEKFNEALSIDPSHLESLGALRTLYIDMEEWGMAAQILDVEQEHTTVLSQKSELLYARGQILANNLHRMEEAIECFKKAIEVDSENENAAVPLIEYYLEHGEFASAEPLLDMLLRRWSNKTPKELFPYNLRLAKVASVLGNDEKALKAYKAAFDADPSNIETIKGMAQTLYRLKNWDKAFKYYQMILVQHMESQNPQEKIEIYYHLGNIKLNLKEPRKALNMFEKALEIDPHHRPTLESLIALFEGHKDYEQVIHFKKTIAESVEGEEKFNLLVEIGDIWQDKLQNSVKAIATYNEALQYNPTDRTLLHKLMTLYSNTKQWPKAVDVLKQIAELEEDNVRRSKYYHSIAIIYHSEIKDTDSAIEYFNKALDADPDNLKDFEAIEQILTPLRDWKQLERNYRKMLHRITGKGNRVLEENLWHNLGEIYRTRMQNYEAAAEAFKMAASYSPDNILRHEILAELYELLPDRWKEAVEEHQWLIRQNPNRIESYKALRKIYQDAHQYDRAWCMCSTLNFLKKADPEEQRFYEQYRMKGLPRAQQPLDNERWVKDLFHPDEDVFIGKIFEIVTPIIFKRKVQPQKAYGLKKKDKKDPFTATEAFARIFGTVVRVLNLPLPEIYVRLDQPFGLQYAITDPPASVVGQALLTGYSPQDLTFIISKHLSYYRGEHYIRLLEPTVAGLKVLLLAAIKTANQNFQLPQDVANQILPVVQVIQGGLLPVQMEQLSKVVRGFLESKAAVDLKKWASSVELTACRVGLLLCNDLETAVRMVNSEPPGLSDVPPKEKVKELILFSVSEEYFRLREALGFAIAV